MTSDRNVRLTIGIPVYKNAATIEEAISSIVADNNLPCDILISDDCSPDDSWSICEAISEKYDNVKAIRQPRNLYYNNFKYLVDQASTPYFVWLSADDYFEPGFLDAAVKCLDEQQDAVAAVGHAAFYQQGQFIGYSNGSESIADDNAEDRVATFFERSTDNNRMYGVFRTEAAQRSFPDKLYHAWDYAFSAQTLCFGKHLNVGVCNHRDKTSTEDYRRLLRRDGKNVVTRLFPLLPMTFELLNKERLYRSKPVFKNILQMNFNYHLNYCEFFHPAYHRWLLSMMKFWTRNIGWRFKRP